MKIKTIQKLQPVQGFMRMLGALPPPRPPRARGAWCSPQPGTKPQGFLAAGTPPYRPPPSPMFPCAVPSPCLTPPAPSWCLVLGSAPGPGPQTRGIPPPNTPWQQVLFLDNEIVPRAGRGRSHVESSGAVLVLAQLSGGPGALFLRCCFRQGKAGGPVLRWRSPGARVGAWGFTRALLRGGVSPAAPSS